MGFNQGKTAQTVSSAKVVKVSKYLLHKSRTWKSSDIQTLPLDFLAENIVWMK